MKKIVLPLLIVLSIVSLLHFRKVSNEDFKKVPLPEIPSPTSSHMPKEKKTLFVPYWSIGNDSIQSNDYKRLIYFGISVHENGIEKDSQGYKKLGQFIQKTDAQKEKLLAIVMTDSSINSKILENKNLQKKIISESIESAKSHSFDGLVLDFELTSLSFQSVIDKINRFNDLFYKQSKQNNLSFATMIFGDAVFRVRPYDLNTLGKSADEVFIMAYDFHKARGLIPGPNFPLYGKEIYGYDFTRMTNDFLKAIPKEKLTVVFGLFGYDWKVNEKGESLEQAKALSFNQIKNEFLNSCTFKKCLIAKDALSQETKISYEDQRGNSHTVWFEDLESVAKKEAFFKTKGIISFAFWAYSYF